MLRSKPIQAADLQIALQYQQAGRAEEARKLYEKILRREPRNADALHLLGLLLIDGGQQDKGLQLLRRAASYAPDSIEVLNNLAVELCRLDRFAEALPVYDKILARHCDRSDVQLNRALALRSAGRLDAALAALDQLIERDQRHAAAVFSRGGIRATLGRTEEALADFDAALALGGDHAECHGNRANALMVLRRFQEAVAAFDQALARRQDAPAFLHRRGLCLHALGREAEALDAYEAALACGGDGPDLLINCATTLAELGRYADAAGCFSCALQERAGDAEALFGLGHAYLALGQHQAALDCFEAGLVSRPGFVPALHNRGAALIALGRHAEASTALSDLLAVSPDYEYARGELFFSRLFRCDWSNYEADRSDIARRIAHGERADMPFMCLAHAESGVVQKACATTHVADKYPATETPTTSPTMAKPKIHIAYLSGDFRTHPVAFLMAGVFEQHDRAQFDVTAISFREAEDSEMGRRVHAAFDRFIDVSGKTDAETASLMRELGVDIAIDLMGHTAGNRPGIYARRAAPAQINYLGFPGTMGADYIDAIIADSFVAPVGSEHLYAEKVIRLPNSFQANDDQRRLAATPSRAEAGLPETGFVFCCFCGAYKMTPAIFGIAMRLLASIPESVLWLAVAAPEARANLGSAATSHGLDPERLVFAKHTTYDAHLARLGLADLALDTNPFNGGTTVSDALWAGIPVVTRAGEPFAARMAGSLLRTIGLPDLITSSFEEYEATALSLARSPGALSAMRQNLQAAIKTSPLFNTAAFCRDFEAALTDLHEGTARLARHP